MDHSLDLHRLRVDGFHRRSPNNAMERQSLPLSVLQAFHNKTIARKVKYGIMDQYHNITRTVRFSTNYPRGLLKRDDT